MMKFKLDGNTLLNADIESPHLPYAEFSSDLCQDVPRKIVLELNHGSIVLDILGRYHGETNFHAITEMVKELKDAYKRYSYGHYYIERTNHD